MEAEIYYEGGSARARFRVLSVDAVTEARSPETSLSSVTIRFRNPDGTVLVTKTLADGVVNAGDGYYYATAVPTQEGRHVVECDVGGAIPQRSKVGFTVEP